ncbi:hypothetical protein RKD33_004707 [Streptomyces sp. SAI-129]
MWRSHGRCRGRRRHPRRGPAPGRGTLPPFVSVLCQGADRANASVDLDGFPLDRPALSEHFHFEFRDFDPESIALRIRRPDLTVITGADHVAAALNPQVWH